MFQPVESRWRGIFVLVELKEIVMGMSRRILKKYCTIVGSENRRIKDQSERSKIKDQLSPHSQVLAHPVRVLPGARGLLAARPRLLRQDEVR